MTVRLYFYSFFGTALCYEVAAQRFCHRPLEDLDPACPRLYMEASANRPPALGAAADVPLDFSRIALGPGAHPKTVSLKIGENFISTLSFGDAGTSTTRCGNWETFLLLTERDVRLLQHIARNDWALEDAPGARAGAAKFLLAIGQQTFRLADNLPFDPACTDEALLLNAAAGQAKARRRDRVRQMPAVWINPLGNIGNRALQYLAAAGIQEKVPGCVVRNIRLEMWGMDAPAPRPPAHSSAGTSDRYSIDVLGLADCLRRGEVETVIVDSFPYCIDHYPSRATCRRLLPAISDTGAIGFGAHELVCSIRANEILRALHDDYFPLPAAYYKMLQKHSGLDLVFFGQIGSDAYSRSLRQAFPDARFVAGKNPSYDFEVLRRSRNIALSISSFAWLAAWLSEAQRVFMPVGGMFSPVQHPDQMYLPFDEPEYEYFLLPPMHAVNLFAAPERFWQGQAQIGALTRPIAVEALKTIAERAMAFGRGRVMTGHFNSAFYLRHNADVAADAALLQTTALDHFIRQGAAQKRLPCEFDELFYAETYPEVAEAVAMGLFPTLLAHFMREGFAKGYRPTPEAVAS